VQRTNILLQCGKCLIIRAVSDSKPLAQKQKGCRMTEIWDTKDGRRRVRRDPPTVEEAVAAAQGLTEEISEQIEIVASLMEVSADEARGAVLRLAQRKDVNRFTIAGRPGASRAVIVERRVTRRPLRASGSVVGR
jgi:hypothetical protein